MKYKYLSIKDKLIGLDYIWTILFSLFFYVAAFKSSEDIDVWILLICGLGVKYLFSVITRRFIEEISVPFNIYLEIILYGVVLILATLFL